MRNALHCLPELDGRIEGRPLLLVTDFDGSLCPFADSPWAVRVPVATAELVHELQLSRRARLVVVSGRSVDDLELRVPWPAVLAGNYGLEVRGGGLQFQHPTAFRLRGALASARDCVAQAVGQVPGVWLEDKGLTITVHYRSVPAPQQRAVALAIRHCFATFPNGLALRAGKKAIDIHPRCDWSKGDALRWIRAQLRWQETVCMCVGDDRLDEPMFAANEDGINIRVGWSDRTAAHYWVRDPLDLIGVFAHLARTLLPGAVAAEAAATVGQTAPRL